MTKSARATTHRSRRYQTMALTHLSSLVGYDKFLSIKISPILPSRLSNSAAWSKNYRYNHIRFVSFSDCITSSNLICAILPMRWQFNRLCKPLANEFDVLSSRCRRHKALRGARIYRRWHGIMLNLYFKTLKADHQAWAVPQVFYSLFCIIFRFTVCSHQLPCQKPSLGFP